MTRAESSTDDPCPQLECLDAGEWALEKHELLRRYVHASWAARQSWTNRSFIDLFCGPGRIQIRGDGSASDGGALVAWRQALVNGGRFTQVVVGDADCSRANACKSRLEVLGAPVVSLVGPASTTVDEVLKIVPSNGLHLAYLDPFNMGHLPFDVIQKLARFRNIDIVVHFSVMDLQRDIELDFERDVSRFDVFAPGWKNHVNVQQVSKQRARAEFVDYWLGLVNSLGFKCSMQRPLISNSRNGPLYRMMFLMRHPLANKLWDDISRGINPNRELF